MMNDDSAREDLVYELGNMFAARLGLEELIPIAKTDGIPAAAPQSGERGPTEKYPAVAKISLQDAKEAYEVRYISQVLTEHGGNVSHAAVALCLSRVALQKKMKRYGSANGR
jgi:DNA-binding NtrC family response regulator